MADWYVSSAAYSSVSAFVASHAYSIGDFVKPTSPGTAAKYVFRCTTAGTSSTEPSWTSSNNGTNTSGTATFTNVTGQGSFFWSAASGDLNTIASASRGVINSGDRVFLSSDHTETVTNPSYGIRFPGTATNPNLYLSVNRAGSTPPVAADLLAGATLIGDTGFGLNNSGEAYWYGVTMEVTTSGNLTQSSSGSHMQYFKSCTWWLNHTGSTAQMQFGTTFVSTVTVFDNHTLQFGHTGQQVVPNSNGQSQGGDLTWLNGSIGGSTFPTTLFNINTVPQGFVATLRGVDLSNITGTLVSTGSTNDGQSKFLFESCKIASGAIRYANGGSTSNTRDLVAFANCYNGTNQNLAELYTPMGSVTTEYSTLLQAGAVDDISSFSHKMVSNANAEKWVAPLIGFWMDVENTATGSSKTATVEIISSTTLNNDECYLWIEYEGTSGSSITSAATSQPTNILTSAAAITSSSATWINPPASAVKQKLQVSFTAQHAGRVHGRVMLGKTSTTLWYNPQITIT